MELKEYTKHLEIEKNILQKEILKKVKYFEEKTGLSIGEIGTVKMYGGKTQKSRIIEINVKAEV